MFHASQNSGLWFISRDKGLPVVRWTFRDSSGVRRGERYLAKKYHLYQNDRPILANFVVRINGRVLVAKMAQEMAASRNAHIDDTLFLGGHRPVLGLQNPPFFFYVLGLLVVI